MDVPVLEALFYPEHLRLWLETDQKRSDKILTYLISAARRLEGLSPDKACWQIREEK